MVRGTLNMNDERAKIGWGDWGWWLLACIVGFMLGFVVANATFGFGAPAGIVIGVSLGIAQWLVLRRYIARAGWWVLASIVGLAVGFGVCAAVLFADDFADDVGFAMAGAVAGTVIGASLGIAQWLVLRRHVARAGWWVLASAVGVATFETVDFAMSFDPGGAFIVGVAVYGAITGGVLVWLLRQPALETAA